MNCEHCGKPLINKRKDARYCSPTCRAYASRERKRAQKRAQELTLTFEGRALLEQLRAILPKTADSAERFVELHGVSCTEAAVKLCLTAYTEAMGKAS